MPERTRRFPQRAKVAAFAAVVLSVWGLPAATAFAISLESALEKAEDTLAEITPDVDTGSAADDGRIAAVIDGLRDALADADAKTDPFDVRRARYLLAFALLASGRAEPAAVLSEASAGLGQTAPAESSAETAEVSPEDRAAAAAVAVRAYLDLGRPVHLDRARGLARRLADEIPDAATTAEVLLAVATADDKAGRHRAAAESCDLVSADSDRYGNARLAAGQAYAAAAKVTQDAAAADRLRDTAIARFREGLAETDAVGSLRAQAEFALADLLATRGDVAGAIETLGRIDVASLPPDSPLRDAARLRPLRLATEAGDVSTLPAAVTAAIGPSGMDVGDGVAVAVLDALDRLLEPSPASTGPPAAAAADAVRNAVDRLFASADGRPWLLAGVSRVAGVLAEKTNDPGDRRRSLAADVGLFETAGDQLEQDESDPLQLRIVRGLVAVGEHEEARPRLAELLGRHAGELAYEVAAARLVDLAEPDGRAAVAGGTLVPDGPEFLGWNAINNRAAALLRAGKVSDEAAFARVAAVRDEARLRIVETTRAAALADDDAVARHAKLDRARKLAEAFAGNEDDTPANASQAAIVALLPTLREEAESTRAAAEQFAGGPGAVVEPPPEPTNLTAVAVAITAGLAAFAVVIVFTVRGRRRGGRNVYEPADEELVFALPEKAEDGR